MTNPAVGKLGKTHFEDLDIDGKIILKFIFKKENKRWWP
jgi:hypothetical protein